MRGIDISAKVRNAERALGLAHGTIEMVHPGEFGQMFRLKDPQLDGQLFIQPYTEAGLERLHQQVYGMRGKYRYFTQNGLCHFCGTFIRAGMYEIHHIKHRGANGRDDSIDNLAACHPSWSKKCKGHALEHGQGKKFRIKNG